MLKILLQQAHAFNGKLTYLLPAYVVRGKVMFWHQSVCLSTFVGGGGGTPSQVWLGGYLIPGLARRGVPHPRSGQGLPHPRSGWGTPQTWDGVPPQGLGWGTPRTCDGVPPWTWDRVSYKTWDRVPPWDWDRVPSPPQHSKHLLCYVAGGMLVAFTAYITLCYLFYGIFLKGLWPLHYFWLT